MAVHNLIKKIKETGSTERRKGSGRPVTATTEENASIFEELVCSQEDEPGTHNSIRQIAFRISISKSWVHRLVKKNNLHCYKRLKTLQMNSAYHTRWADLAGKLLQRFFIHSLPQLVFQDEKDFSLQVSTNGQNNWVYFTGPKYFWGSVQEKVYDGRYCYPFATTDELKRRIRDIWDQCATDPSQSHNAMKQFLPCLEAVDAKESGSIKTVFG